MELILKKVNKLIYWLNWRGHFSVGPVTVFGANAMDWHMSIVTKKWGYVCMSLPVLARIKKVTPHTPTGYFGYYLQWYFYVSPNSTPWACTFYRGNEPQSWKEKLRAEIRYRNLGHNFNTSNNYDKLRAINIKYESFTMWDTEIRAIKQYNGSTF